MLLQHDSFDFVAPDRQMVFKPKFRDEMSDVLRFLRLASFLSPDLDYSTVCKPDVFGQMIQHHHPAKGSRQGRNQQPVISPRYTAADCSRGIAAQPIGREPFPAQQLPGVLAPSASQVNLSNQLLHSPLPLLLLSSQLSHLTNLTSFIRLQHHSAMCRHRPTSLFFKRSHLASTVARRFTATFHLPLSSIQR